MTQEFTLGVEEEFQLVDPETRELKCRYENLIEVLDASDAVQLHKELHKSVVEVATGVCENIADARRQVISNRYHAARVAERAHLKLAAASTHPFADWQDQEISDDDTYKKLVNDLQEIARANVIFGMHVHVAIPDVEERIKIFNSVRYFLPHFLALSTSSPFWCGRNTGVKSMRSLIFERLPRTGIPERFESFSEFNEYVQLLVNTGCIDSGKRLWWDIRPHPAFPTLEVRICDLPTRVDDVISIAAVVQAVVVKLARIHRQNMSWRNHRGSLLAENKWRAVRYGVEGNLIDFGKLTEVPFTALAQELLDFTDDVVDDLDSRGEVENILRIVREGTSADRQLRVFEESGGDLNAVVDQILEDTMLGVHPEAC